MTGSSFTSQKTYNTWLLLKITYGLLFVIAGADKFFNLIVHWGKYVSPVILDGLKINSTTLLIVVAAIEIILGLLVLTKWTRTGAYGIALWFFIIIVNLLTMMTYFDIAVRDAVLAVGAIALVRLTDIKDEIK